LAESEVGGFASAYDLTAQAQAFPASPPVYYQPFLEVILAMYSFAESRQSCIEEVTFDSRLESDFNAGMIYANMAEDHPEWRVRLASKISFETSRKNPGIQIADLFAREAMKHLDNRNGPKKRPARKSWEAIYATGRFEIECREKDYWDRLLREDPYSQSELAGIKPGQYERWLETHNRQRSHTSYFEFLRSRFRGMSDEQKLTLGKVLRDF
jgi:hypothetical protein